MGCAGGGEMGYRGLGPDCPMAQQSAREASFSAAEIELGEQIYNNVVVVAGIESDFWGTAGFHNCADNIQRLIAVEWRDFYGNHFINLREFAPEAVGQQAATYAGLQVETDNRNGFRDGSRVLD